MKVFTDLAAHKALTPKHQRKLLKLMESRIKHAKAEMKRRAAQLLYPKG